jgi:hypothetical protein
LCRATDENRALEANPETQNPSENKKASASSALNSPACPLPLAAHNTHFFSSLPPEVIANNALYEQKVMVGEIMEISNPGELARVDYFNPGDRDFFFTREQSGTARFVSEPETANAANRKHWLPPLRKFGPKPKPNNPNTNAAESLAPSSQSSQPDPSPNQ